MKKLIPLLLILVFSSACKKTIQQTQEDLVLLAMTNGQWKITSFTVNSNNISSDFADYKFKYHSNKTVDAVKNGLIERTGLWDGNSANKTTWAEFSGAAHPIVLINGTWNIVNNSWIHVTASQTNGAETKVMRLDKE
jgi:hypothetical protein